ncbi:hypothetical protein BJV78DRAFT_1358674 [Lactifluus subvellereus]|nr:hypothetical protein BJV78DRAFT_1358674 [Lactifluus subvellereus]
MSELHTHLSELFRPTHEADDTLVDKIWTTYIEQAEKYDARLANTLIDDATSVLVFSGLFAATVSAFILESYKRLSPDSGERVIVLLEQISQQLALENNTRIPFQSRDDVSFSPSVAIICVNVLWFLSLYMCITSAFSATVFQQVAHRYTQMPLASRSPRERARIRSFLFIGALEYYLFVGVQGAVAWLHLSLFPFAVGLTIFLFTISNTVALVIAICGGFAGLAYFILTILPFIDHAFPYYTPTSGILWFTWHISLSLTEFCLWWLLRHLCGFPAPFNVGEDKLIEWSQFFKAAAFIHWRQLGRGFHGRIIRGALDAPVDVDIKALTWLLRLPALAEKSKLQEFVADIPGETAVQLMNDRREYGESVFRNCLFDLLRSCVPGTAGLDEDTRKRRLFVCLGAIYRITKASIVPCGVLPSESVLSDVRKSFANVGLMRQLWTDKDPAIRVIARSICALLARHLLRKHPLAPSELAWLQDVIGVSSTTILESLDDSTAIGRMNVDSFVNGVLSNQTDDLLIDQTTSFVETLAILMIADNQTAPRMDIFREWFSTLIQRAEQDDRLHKVVDKLHRIFEDIFPGTHQSHKYQTDELCHKDGR